MANELKMVIFENVTKMMLMGLDGRPFIQTDEEKDILIEIWLEALEDSGFNDSDAPKIAKCWRAMRRTQTKWFKPAQLIQSVRSVYVPPSTPALPNISDEQAKKNLVKVGELMTTLKLGKLS